VQARRAIARSSRTRGGERLIRYSLMPILLRHMSFTSRGALFAAGAHCCPSSGSAVDSFTQLRNSGRPVSIEIATTCTGHPRHFYARGITQRPVFEPEVTMDVPYY